MEKGERLSQSSVDGHSSWFLAPRLGSLNFLTEYSRGERNGGSTMTENSSLLRELYRRWAPGDMLAHYPLSYGNVNSNMLLQAVGAYSDGEGHPAPGIEELCPQ